MTATACNDKPQPAAVVATAAASAASAAPSKPAAPITIYEKVVMSSVYEVDRIYKSMVGPNSTADVHLIDPNNPELLWIVGFEAIMVEPKGDTRISQEFMCHANLDIDATQHLDLFGARKSITGRLFTLSQGQHRIDIPAGFGIPIVSTEVLSLNTQVLNLNIEKGTRQVRHRVIMRYARDSELTTPMKPLYPVGAYGLKLLDGKDGHYGLTSSDKADAKHGPGCLPGANAGENVFDDHAGRKFTGHWVVKPGREKNHTRVTKIMDLPFDTTVHYVAVHLHPFAESLELRDLTTNKPVYKAFTRQSSAGVGLDHVDFFASAQGFALLKGHEYELVSVYNNTSGKPQDSMAVMNMYALDKEFKKPDLSQLKLKLERDRRSNGKPAATSKPGAM